MILCSKSFAQLRATFEEYESAAGHTFEEGLKKEFSGDMLKVFTAIGNFNLFVFDIPISYYQISNLLSGFSSSMR